MSSSIEMAISEPIETPPKPKPDFCSIPRVPCPLVPGVSFAMGRPPYNTLEEKEAYLKQWKRAKTRDALEKKRRLAKQNRKVPVRRSTHPRRPAFPLTPAMGKQYGFFLEWILHYFPKNSIQAIQHFHTIIAPPLPGSKKLYLMTRDDISSIGRAFLTQLRCRWSFRAFLNIYLSRKSKKINECDPITLEPFKHPITIMNLNTRSIYVFESKMLAKMWSTNLLQHDGLFMEPRSPINPFTNLPFNDLQLAQGIQQLRKNGHLDWVLETFAACHFDMKRWQQKFGVSLRVEAIQNVFADKNSIDRYDMLIDFIEMQHEFHAQRFDKKFYEWILHSPETVDFAHLWSLECRRYYIDKYTAWDKEDIDDLEVRTSIYCSKLVETPEIIKKVYENFLESKRKKRNVSNLSVTISFPHNPELPVVNRIIGQGSGSVSTNG